MLYVPVFSYAQTVDTGIVYDCQLSHQYRFNQTTQPGQCTFADLLYEVQNLVAFGRNIALELSVIFIAYAGFLYLTSGDKPAQRQKANKVLLNVVYGIIFILAAWLIVNLITNVLLGKSLTNIF